MKPLTIVLTGINGAGKDTHAEPLAAWLDGTYGFPAEFIYAPKVTTSAAAFRSAVLDGRPNSPIAEMLGYYAQHAESDTFIADLQRQSPRHLVINRGPETTLVYNALAHQFVGLSRELALVAHRTITNILSPSLTILLDIDLETSRLRSAMQLESDYIQERDVAYFRRLICAYRMLAQTEPRWEIVDATPTDPGIVFQAIQAKILPLLQRR